MEPVGRPRVKVCCIGNAREARAAVWAGAAALGFVSRMPSGPGVIDEALIAEIVRGVPPGVGTFLLTSSQNADEIIAQQRRCRVNTVQICDRLITGSYADLHAAMPGVSIVQAVHVVGEESVAEAEAVASVVDAILLDSGKPNLAVKELGGTGRRHNWRISRRIRESVAVPVFLAGGLRAENVAEAIEVVRPFALDVCSGVRTDGKLDEAKLESFMNAVESAISA